MPTLTFVEHPTRADLDAYTEAMDLLRENRRFHLSRAIVAREARTKNTRIAPARFRELANEESAQERFADELLTRMWELENLHQVQAHDYREYVSRGLPLPVERAVLYEARTANLIGSL